MRLSGRSSGGVVSPRVDGRKTVGRLFFERLRTVTRGPDKGVSDPGVVRGQSYEPGLRSHGVQIRSNSSHGQCPVRA